MFSPEDKEHAEAQVPHCMQVSISLAPSLLTSLYKSGLIFFLFTLLPFEVLTQAIGNRLRDCQKMNGTPAQPYRDSSETFRSYHRRCAGCSDGFLQLFDEREILNGGVASHNTALVVPEGRQSVPYRDDPTAFDQTKI